MRVPAHYSPVAAPEVLAVTQTQENETEERGTDETRNPAVERPSGDDVEILWDGRGGNERASGVPDCGNYSDLDSAGNVGNLGAGGVASGAEQVVSDEQKSLDPLASKSVGKSGNTHGKFSGYFSGQIPVSDSSPVSNIELPTKLPTKKSVGKSSDLLASKSVANSAKSSGASERFEWFRYEIEVRPATTGHRVLIRRRLRWSVARKGRTIVTRHCPELTKTMASQIKKGRFTDATKRALQQGGITYGFIRILIERSGKGTGKGASQLTDDQRRVIARYERQLDAGCRRRTAGNRTAERDERRDSRPDLPTASTGDFADVSDVPTVNERIN